MIIDSEEKSEKKYKFTRKTKSELEKQRKEMEEKYNINLDVLTEKGCKTYRDLRDYFTNICETNCLIFYIDNKYVCCGKPNMEEIEENVIDEIKDRLCVMEEIEKRLGDRINDPPCDDPYYEGCREHLK